MRILISSTLKRSVRPDNFASRSRIIYQLAKGLAQKGHEVALLGTGDSYVEGVKTIPVTPVSFVDMPATENAYMREVSYLLKQARMLTELQSEYDIIHNHTYPDVFPTVIEDLLTIPLVTTMHAVAADYLDEVLSLYPKTNFVALSEGYKKLYQKTRIAGVVYNGVDTNLYAYQEEKQDYLFWLGRLPLGKRDDGEFIDPKGVRWAIELARKTNTPLYLGGLCEDPAFFERDVKPYLSDTIQWVGEVSTEQSIPIERVVELMQGAKAFLMTINQEEPFGLVMAEAGSCGTPVIAFDRGSVREVIKDGETGITVDPQQGIDGLVAALEKVKAIHPKVCREHVEKHFSVESMVSSYEKLYQDLVAS